MKRTVTRTACLLALMAGSLVSFVGCASEDPFTTGDDQYATENAGVFETFRGQDGQYYFHLVAANGEKVLQSEGYTSRASAEKGIASVKANGVDAANYHIEESVDGEHYFNLVAQNHEIIATSETYVSRSNAERGADTAQELVVRNLRIEAAETGGARFQLFEGRDGQTYFRLRAGNGEIVLQSEGYVAEAGALNGIESVRDNGKIAERYEIVQAQNGQHYFRLEAANHEVIARSELYASLSNAERGADTVMDLLQSERVADPE